MQSPFGIPVLDEPEGDSDTPILSGKVSISMRELIQSEVISENLSMWAICMNNLALAEVMQEK